MLDCNVCSALRNPGQWGDLWIYHDRLVMLGHVPPSADDAADCYPGHLLLVSQRHVESQAALTAEEAERMGLWLALGSRLLESRRAAEHVYLFRLGDSWPHLHLHLVPRYPGTPAEYRGLDVRDWPGVARCNRQDAAVIAGLLREAAAAL